MAMPRTTWPSSNSAWPKLQGKAPGWSCCRNCTTAPTSASTRTSASSSLRRRFPVPSTAAPRPTGEAARRGAGRLAVRASRRRPVPQHRRRAATRDGSIAGKYRKMHIPDDPGFNEKFYFTPGDLGFDPVDTSRRPPRRARVLGPVVSGRRAPDGAGRRRTAALPDRHRLGSRRRRRPRRIASATPGCSAIAATRSPTACRC